MALPLDKTLINIRVDVIDKNLKEVETIVGEGEERFLKDYRTTLAGKHALLESIEACIDIGNHIIEGFEKLPFSPSKHHQNPLEGFDHHKKGYSKPSIAGMGLRRPEDYKDVFAVLEEEGILNGSLSEKLQNMAKFRNLLVHFYTKVDDRRVFAIMKKDGGDMRDFAKAVLEFISAKKQHS